MARPRTYPHVDQVRDPQIQQALRILFDRVMDLTEGVDGANATIEEQAATIATLSAQLTATADLANAALEVAGKLTSASPGTTIPPVGGGGGDDGSGAQGCAMSPDTGHVVLTPEQQATLNPENIIGMIVCGTAKEWSSLLAPAVDGPTRDANLAELLSRIIWHLNAYGYTAGNNRNPSGAIGIDNVTVVLASGTIGFDIFPASNFSAYGDFAAQATVQMIKLLPGETTYVPNGGTPD